MDDEALLKLLTRIRDAGALDDNHGAEDWTLSDKEIDSAMLLIKQDREANKSVEGLHPEDYCHKCNGPNISWSAPSPLWNEVMRDGDIDGPVQYEEIICPTCFAFMAREKGIAEHFRFDASEVNVELKTVTPGGRVWDEEKWLWVTPTNSKADHE